MMLRAAMGLTQNTNRTALRKSLPSRVIFQRQFAEGWQSRENIF
jgi:hypothetical protein